MSQEGYLLSKLKQVTEHRIKECNEKLIVHLKNHEQFLSNYHVNDFLLNKEKKENLEKEIDYLTNLLRDCSKEFKAWSKS